MKRLSRRQGDVLVFITKYLAANEWPPTIREIAAGLGMAQSHVFHVLGSLERKGYIKRAPKKARAITLLVPMAEA